MKTIGFGLVEGVVIHCQSYRTDGGVREEGLEFSVGADRDGEGGVDDFLPPSAAHEE